MIKTVKEPITRVEERNEYSCDLCGCEMESEHESINKKVIGGNCDNVRLESWEWEDKWEEDYRAYEEVMRVHMLDCCIDCFKNKVRPLIESTFNVKFRESVL